MHCLGLFTHVCLIGKLGNHHSGKSYFCACVYSTISGADKISYEYCVFHCYRLVTTINTSIGQDPESKILIGVLDIYGFESFKTNRCLTGMLLHLIYYLRSCTYRSHI